MVVTVSSRDGSLSETALADYITRNIQNPVSRVPGVGKFQLFASGRAMRVWVDPDKLTGCKLSMGDVNNAIGRQNVLISGGTMGSPPNHEAQRGAAPIVVNGKLTTDQEVGDIVMRQNADRSTEGMHGDAGIEVGANT